MPGQQEQELREAVFDESGETLDDGGAAPIVEEPGDGGGEPDGETGDAPPTEGKYRIGDQTFNTLAEAQAFATQAVQQGDENAAYRRLVQEIVQTKPPGENVTPKGPQIDEERLWADPKSFLADFAKQIQDQTAQNITQSLHQQRVQQENDNAIFAEFTNRHPDLAEFRQEVEQFTGQNQQIIANLANTKGRTAAFDYVALHLRERFNKYAEASRPRKVLKNGGGAAPPASRGTGVTPPARKNKPLSLAEQIATIKKVKR
jgi:hypothetical protein